MLQLFLLRHAKAEAAAPSGKDHDRRLAPAGRADSAWYEVVGVVDDQHLRDRRQLRRAPLRRSLVRENDVFEIEQQFRVDIPHDASRLAYHVATDDDMTDQNARNRVIRRSRLPGKLNHFADVVKQSADKRFFRAAQTENLAEAERFAMTEYLTTLAGRPPRPPPRRAAPGGTSGSRGRHPKG